VLKREVPEKEVEKDSCPDALRNVEATQTSDALESQLNQKQAAA